MFLEVIKLFYNGNAPYGQINKDVDNFNQDRLTKEPMTKITRREVRYTSGIIGLAILAFIILGKLYAEFLLFLK